MPVSLSTCELLHAFIYAEPKQINKNQSDQAMIWRTRGRVMLVLKIK
jgi:hypothetical protein